MMDVSVASIWKEKQWKCLKHTSQRFHGVCPGCLTDRLILLCPDCANLRPCRCLPSCSSSSSSSLSFFDLPRSSVGSGIGDVGRVGNLIDSEPAFQRSRSVAFQFVKSRPFHWGDNGGEEREKVGSRRRRSLFCFLRKLREKDATATNKMRKTRSVAERKILGWRKGWNWHFSSPIIGFSHRKSEKVLKDRSASRRERSGSF